MKDEIKEIDRIIINVKRKLQFSPERRFVELFDKGDIKQLLDYITNLQEENERLKEIIKENTILVKDENGNYQECNINPLDYKTRNEKVISYIDSLFNTIDYDDEEFITFDTLESIQNLAKYGQLQGKSDE